MTTHWVIISNLLMRMLILVSYTLRGVLLRWPFSLVFGVSACFVFAVWSSLVCLWRNLKRIKINRYYYALLLTEKVFSIGTLTKSDESVHFITKSD